MWDEVRLELLHFSSLLPLVAQEWARPWSPSVFALDASELGWGVTVAQWDPDTVGAVGCLSERARFRRCAAAPRRHAFEAAGLALPGDLEAAHEAAAGINVELSGEWVRADDFEEVPAAVLGCCPWAVVAAGRRLLFGRYLPSRVSCAVAQHSVRFYTAAALPRPTVQVSHGATATLQTPLRESRQSHRQTPTPTSATPPCRRSRPEATPDG